MSSCVTVCPSVSINFVQIQFDIFKLGYLHLSFLGSPKMVVVVFTAVKDVAREKQVEYEILNKQKEIVS